MTALSPYLLGALVAVVTGLDRTAALQVMISRPLVAASLAGLLLGDFRTGLMIGALLELLWLSRLPVGASVPHDDTQTAVGATVLAIVLPGAMPGQGIGLTLLCVLTTMPLAKVGQLIERYARTQNNRLQEAARSDLAVGKTDTIERLHLTGLLHFALAALATYGVIVFSGGWLVRWLAPFFVTQMTAGAVWIKLALVLVAIGALLRTMNVKRAYWLFGFGFLLSFLLHGWLR